MYHHLSIMLYLFIYDKVNEIENKKECVLVEDNLYEYIFIFII